MTNHGYNGFDKIQGEVRADGFHNAREESYRQVRQEVPGGGQYHYCAFTFVHDSARTMHEPPAVPQPRGEYAPANKVRAASTLSTGPDASDRATSPRHAQ